MSMINRATKKFKISDFSGLSQTSEKSFGKKDKVIVGQVVTKGN